MKTKTIRESILNGTFNLKEYNEINYINPNLKKLQNLQSWSQFYKNRCTDGTGIKTEITNQKTGLQMMVDVNISRKTPFRDYMYVAKVKGELSSFSGVQGSGQYLKTTKDLKDEESFYFLDGEIRLLQEQQKSYYNNKRRN